MAVSIARARELSHVLAPPARRGALIARVLARMASNRWTPPAYVAAWSLAHYLTDVLVRKRGAQRLMRKGSTQRNRRFAERGKRQGAAKAAQEVHNAEKISARFKPNGNQLRHRKNVRFIAFTNPSCSEHP